VAALAGFLGDILITSPPSVNLPNPLVLTNSGDNQTFNNPTASQRYWDNLATFTVQTSTNGGSTWSTAAAGTYTIRYVNGQVKLNTVLTGTPACQLIAGKYFPYASIGNTTSWDAQPAVKAVEATTHKGVGGSPFQDWVLTTAGGKVNFKKWWIDNTYFTSLTSRTLLIASCLTPQGNRFEAYGRFSDQSISSVKDGLIESSLVFLFTDQVYAF